MLELRATFVSAVFQIPLQSWLRFKRARLKRVAGLREIKIAWHTHSLKPNLPRNPPSLHCCSPVENLSNCCTAVHLEGIIASETHISQLYWLQDDALRRGFALRGEAGPHAGPSAVYDPQMPCLWKLSSWTVRFAGPAGRQRNATCLPRMRQQPQRIERRPCCRGY